jgi:hypothetical protein
MCAPSWPACAASAIFQAAAPSRPIAAACPAGAAGARDGGQVLRPPAPVPAERHLRARRREISTAPRWPAGWTKGDELLDPLVAALGRYTLAGAKVHADDTPVKVLAPGAGKTKTGRLWVYVRDDRPAASKRRPAAWFPTRPTAAANIRRRTCAASAARCRPMPMAAGRSSTTAGRSGGSLLGACATALVGPVPAQRARRRTPGRAGAERIAGALRDRGRHPGPAARRARRAATGARRTAAEGLARLAEGLLAACRPSRRSPRPSATASRAGRR